MLKENNKILKYNHGESMKVPFIIYADLESLLQKINTCHNVLKKSSTTKMNKHTPSIYCVHIVHLILQKTNLIILEVEIV